jgi:hypothetical protein
MTGPAKHDLLGARRLQLHARSYAPCLVPRGSTSIAAEEACGAHVDPRSAVTGPEAGAA